MIGEKYKKYKKVLIAPHIYRKLELDSDKTGYPINDLINMHLHNMYEQRKIVWEKGQETD
jgi:hypothetical protein